MNRAIIGIGSNVEPRRHVPRALEALAAEFHLVGQTAPVLTQAVGPAPGADFLNCAVLIETDLDRQGLDLGLKELETRLGRVRTADKFAPRTIDLDLVVWNGQVVHPDVEHRDFLRREVEELMGKQNAK